MTVPNDTEEIRALILRRNKAASDDAKLAFEELIRRVTSTVRFQVSRICRNHADREQVMQDVWTKLWQLPLDASQAGTFRGWVRVIAFRVALDQCRRPAGDEVPEIPSRPGQHAKIEADDALASLFDGTLPPHQVLAFAFRSLLEYHPREIVEELSDTLLRNLLVRFMNEYAIDSAGRISKTELKRICSPTADNMDKLLKEVLLDPNSRKTYPYLLERITGDTVLLDYKKSKLDANISHWRESVVTALQRRFGLIRA